VQTLIAKSSLSAMKTDQVWLKSSRSWNPVKPIACLVHRGVGKTTLLNHLVGRNAFKTNLVRDKDGKGETYNNAPATDSP